MPRQICSLKIVVAKLKLIQEMVEDGHSFQTTAKT